MSTDSIQEILMLCEEFIPGDSGDPAEFFFDKVSGDWVGWSYYFPPRTRRTLPLCWRCIARANFTFRTEAEVGFCVEIEKLREWKFVWTAACAMVMRRDFEYWGIDELDLEPCCALKFYPNIEICNTQIEGDIQDKIKEEREKDLENFGLGVVGRTR